MNDELDLSPYAGHWVALVRGRVAGVGRTADEARHAAQTSRPKEKPQLRFVFAKDWQNFALLHRLWGFIQRRGERALLVGGAVRDGLLGRPLHDLDFVVDGDATALAAAISRAFHGALVPLDPGRDTARVVVRHAGRRFDVDLARRQGEDWHADLRARDFTVNAIAVDAAGRYLDPLGGREDLAAGRLQAASEGAFRDDPLRTLRAVRLVAEVGLRLEPQTVAWIRRDAPLLPRAAAERIRDEFARIVAAPGAATHLGLLDDLGLLVQVLPEITALRGLEQSPPHRWDVWTHSRMVVAALEGVLAALSGGRAGGALDVPGWAWGDVEKRLGPLQADLAAHLDQIVSDDRDRRLALKLAALLHDVGKPQTRSLGEDGRIHFYGHEDLGAELAAGRLRALRFSSDEVALVQTIVAHHLRPGHLSRSKNKNLSRRATYRYFRATDAAGVEVGLLSLADMLATWSPVAFPGRRWLHRLEVVATLFNTFFDQPHVVAPVPLVDGHELMEALGLSPGPEVGRLLEAIREAQAAGQIKSKEAALALADRLKRGA